MRKKLIFGWLSLLASLLWTSFIFSNSLDNGVKSGEKSSAVYDLVCRISDIFGLPVPITEATLRTFAHFVEFAVLAFLLGLTLFLLFELSLCAPLSAQYAILLLAFPLSVAIAVLDELIQRFSPGRASQFSDVLIDSFGALMGLFALLIFLTLLRLLYKKRLKTGRIR